MPVTIPPAIMPPAKKLLIAAAVLAVGVGLSWPFRIQSEPSMRASLAEIPLGSLSLTSSEPSDRLLPVVDPSPSTAERGNAPTGRARFTATELPPLPVRQAAKPIVLRSPPPSLPVQYEADLGLQETDVPRPTYATGDISSFSRSSVPIRQPTETIHEVENSDTLAKLAKRYLGDPARALEIFDLNRDKLSNPHLLPIGAELRIPTNAEFGLQNAE